MKMKRYIPIILLCGLLTGCTRTLTTGGIEGVIFPANKAGFANEATGRKDAPRWTPSETDIANAVPVIKAFLAKESPSIASRLQEYRCQYFGIIVDGQKRMYCNFFRRGTWDEGWRAGPIFVLDGGDDFFQLEYDVESQRCLDFMVNGEA